MASHGFREWFAGRKGRMLFPFLLAVATASCAGVLSPYVRPEHPNKHPFRQERGKSQDKDKSLSLNEAIRYADEVRGAYRDALRNQGLLSTGLGVVLIPITGIVAYEGIIGAGKKLIAGTSIAGASLLGAGVYVHSSPRQIIYAEAAAAITCAIAVVAPLQLSDDEVQHLRTLVQWDPPKDDVRPNAPKDKVELNLPQVLRALSKVDDAEAAKLAQQIRTGLNAGREALAIIDMAGSQLVATVDGIVDKTDKQIAATIPDPRSLSSGLGGLIPVPKVGAVDLPTLKDVEDARTARHGQTASLVSKLKEVDLDLEQIRGELEFISGIAERVKEVSVKTALSGCGGALENVTTAFRLVPEVTTVSFTYGKGGEHRSIVVGGKPPYFANLLRKPEAGTLTAELLSEPAGYQLRISADVKVKAGDYPVAVRDSSAAEPRIITVRIEEPK